MSTMRTDSSRIAVLSKMAEILDVLTEDSSITLQALSQQLNLPRPTIYRIVQTLIDLGILTPSNQPGRRLIHWASSSRNTHALENASQESLQRLVSKFRDTASIYTRVGSARVCIARVEGVESLRHTIQVGTPLPLHVGSAGRILLAWLDDETRDRLIHESVTFFPGQSPPSFSGWQEIREKQWAISLGERESALGSISVPIFTGTNQVLAALSISGPKERFVTDRQDAIISALQQEAHKITQLLCSAKNEHALSATPQPPQSIVNKED
ncbi:MAG: IclR family transcriptional regulator [Sulfobacillus thermosulfidooxidans]|nr:MAG: IclR family transcriptional regulator [Sulfobacillus thermosulfidooxidans]